MMIIIIYRMGAEDNISYDVSKEVFFWKTENVGSNLLCSVYH